MARSMGIVLWIFLFMELPAQDSSGTGGFFHWPPLKSSLSLQLSDSLQIQLSKPSLLRQIPKNFYDLRHVMPENPFFLDRRESSYYTSPTVLKYMAHIMNRPGPGDVLPILPVALLAARLAMHQLQIRQKIHIDASDYLIPERYWPILKELWKKSPQTFEELYAHSEIARGRTSTILREDMDYLIGRKLVKTRKLPGEKQLYFIAQNLQEARQLIQSALSEKAYDMRQKKIWSYFLDYLNKTEIH